MITLFSASPPYSLSPQEFAQHPIPAGAQTPHRWEAESFPTAPKALCCQERVQSCEKHPHQYNLSLSSTLRVKSGTKE